MDLAEKTNLAAPKDDALTLASLGVIAFAVANVAHEAFGHGLATIAVGDHAVLLTTCYFTSSGYYSKWIPAGGGLMNLLVGLCSLAVLRFSSRLEPVLRYFLVLVTAFNLFFAFGYPAYSGLALFGDWAVVISGLSPQWLWRVLLVAISVAGYYASMRLLAAPMAPFATTGPLSGDSNRLNRMTIIPYVAAIVLSCLASALNPQGWRTMLNSGLPAAAAAFGLTQVANFAQKAPETDLDARLPLQRNLFWIVVGIVVTTFFVGVLGRVFVSRLSLRTNTQHEIRSKVVSRVFFALRSVYHSINTICPRRHPFAAPHAILSAFPSYPHHPHTGPARRHLCLRAGDPGTRRPSRRSARRSSHP